MNYDKISNKNKKILSLAAVVLVAAYYIFMLVNNLMHSALWADEWVEYRISQLNIFNGEMYKAIIGTFQPPLYNWIMHFWLKLNTSLLWFRSFNILIGIASAIFLFLSANKMLGKKWALFSVVILGSTYQWIYCIQECSEYALMLFFIFLLLYFWISIQAKYSNGLLVGFLLSGIAAIYSQYGAAFVVVPVFAFFFFERLIAKEESNKNKLCIVISYVVSGLLFGLPLFFLFAKAQSEANEITSFIAPFNSEWIYDFFMTPGSMIGYFSNLNSVFAWLLALPIIGVILAIIMSFGLFGKKITSNKRSLYIVIALCYVIHFILVKLHIYANVSPDFNVGFCCRYSYFYIPVFILVFVNILDDFFSRFNMNWLKVIITCLVLFVCVQSAVLTSSNWNKAYDNIYADIWYENEGYEDTTFVFGEEHPGFDYYVSTNSKFKEEYLDNVYFDYSESELPERFWIWRSFWKGEVAEEYLSRAEENGYNITIYSDEGDYGQLFYCVAS